MAKSGTVEQAELAFLLDASTACYFLNCLRDISKSYGRGMMKLMSSTECQNLKNLSCKVQEEGESTSQITNLNTRATKTPKKPNTMGRDRVLQMKTSQHNCTTITYG